jgi:hypothetical protein
MAKKTQLSPEALPGMRYSFVGKTPFAVHGFSTSAIHAMKGTTKISAATGTTKISAIKGTSKISARVN